MSKFKKGVAITVLMLVLICLVYAGQMFMINHRNFYALEAGSVADANSALKGMDITEQRNFETKDFYGEYVPGTSFVISYQGRVYYDQGYYMVYKGDYKPVYCIDPLKTAWSVTNKDSLDEINNHNFANLSSYQQEQVSRLVMATEYLYDTTEEPEYLVAGQLLVWQVIGSVLENYTPSLQDEMDKINNKAAAFDFSDMARGSTVGEDDLIYYDTDGQDLIGVPTTPTDPGDDGDGVCDEDDSTDVDCDDGGDGVCDEDDPTDVDCDTDEPTDGDIVIDKEAEVEDKENITNGQEVKYVVTISNESDDTFNFNFQDKLSDENLTFVDSDSLYVNGQEADVTIKDMQDGILIENLTSGDSVEIEYTVTVNFAEGYEVGDPITNTATACIEDSEVCDDDIETIASPDELGIAVEKTIADADADGIVQKDEELMFNILVSNNGSVTQSPVVKDALNDVNVIYDLNAPIYVNGEESEYTVKDLAEDGVVLPSIEPGEEVLVSFSASASGEFIFDTDSELLVSNESKVCIGEECVGADAYLPVGGFEIEKTVEDASGNNIAEAGEILTYNIKIENYNSEKTDITLNDDLATSLVAYSPATPLTIKPEQVTSPSSATLGDLENGLTLKDVTPGQVINISYTVPVLSDITTDGSNVGNYHISNNVEVCNEEECLNDSASITIDPSNPVIDGGDKSVIKNITDADGDGIAEPGEVLTFNVLLSNGTDETTLFTVMDPLADVNVDYVLEDPLTVIPGGNGSFTSGTTIGDLQTGVTISVDANSKFEFMFKASVKDPLEDLTNSFIYNSIKACTSEGCATGGGKIPLDSTTSFEITKKVSDSTGDNVVEPGETFNYEINITNVGNSDSEVYLQDLIDGETLNVDIPLNQQLDVNLPEGAEMTPTSPKLSDMAVDANTMSSNTIDGSPKGIKVTGVPAGETVTVRFTGTGISDMVDGTYVISNTAKAMWESGNGVDSDIAVANIFTDENGGDISSDIAVKKTSLDSSKDRVVSLGEEVNYTIVLSNSSVTSKSIELTDLFSDTNIIYDLTDTFTLKSSDNLATASSNTLESLNSGTSITLGPDSIAYITYSGIATDPAVDSSALYDYNIVDYCADGICNDTMSYIPRESKASFDVTKTALKGGVEVTNITDDESIVYEIVVSNTGNTEIDNLTVQDAKDDNIDINSSRIIKVVDQDGNSIETEPSSVKFSDLLNGDVVIKKLDKGQQAIFKIPATIMYDEYSDENALITNIVNVCDGNEVCVADDATVTADSSKPVEPGAVGVVKEVIEGDPSDGVGTPGETLIYKITISNSYNESKIVTIQDNLDDPNLVYNEEDPLTIRPDDLGGYTVGDLKTGFDYEIPAKSVVQLEFSASIAEEADFDDTQTEVTNLVTVCDYDNICSEGGGHIVLPASQGFLLEKSVKVNGVDSTTAALGDVLTYNFVVKNVKNTPIETMQLIDRNSQFINVATQPINIIDADGNSIVTKTTDDLLDADGITINSELLPNQELTFSYSATVANDLNGATVKHLTNLVGAKSPGIDATKQSRGMSVDGAEGNMYAIDAALVTLDSSYPIVDDFAIIKSAKEETEDGIAMPGEKITYNVMVANLTDTNKTIKLSDTADPNMDYGNSELIFTNIPAENVIPAGATLDNLFDGTLSVTIPPMQVGVVTYSGAVSNPLNDPSASYVYNDVEGCTLEGECSDSSTEIPLEETKGFNVTKDVEIIGKSGSVVQEGDRLKYTITINNNRNSTIENVVLKDVIDSSIPVDLDSRYTMTNSAGDSITPTPSSLRVADLMSDEGVTIGEIPSGDYIKITFDSSAFTSDVGSLEYSHLANIASACVEDTAGTSEEKTQAVETDNGLCASDSAIVTTDATEPPVDNLAVIKEVTETDVDGLSDDIAEPGDNLHFKITLTNSGDSSQSLLLKDALDDPNIVYDLGQVLVLTPSNIETYPSSPVVNDLIDGVDITVDSGELVVVEFDGTVADPLVDPTQTNISNEVSLCTPDGECSNGGGNIILPHIKGFDVQKTVAVNDVVAVDPEDFVIENGDRLDYTITITNNRNTELENITISDVIDDSILVNLNQKLKINGVQSEHKAEELFDGTLVVDTLAKGETVAIQYSAIAKDTIEDDTQIEFTNFVKACTPLTRGQAIEGDEGLCGYDSITVTTDSDGIENPEDKIGVVKTVTQDPNDSNPEPDMVNPGELLTYDIVIYNNKTIPESIVLTDALDDVNLDYDTVLDEELDVNPSAYVNNPTNPTVGDLRDGITFDIPAETYVNVEFEVSVKNPLADTSANYVKNYVTACLEDDSECTDSGTEETLVGNKNFILTKKAYYNGAEITDSDILVDGDRVDYEVTIQNTGNTPLENIEFADLQDDNLEVDYSDTLGYDSTQTTQTDFGMEDLIPANPTLGNLFENDTIQDTGITIPLLDSRSQLVFTYQAVVDIKTNAELEATNIVAACAPSELRGQAEFNPITNELCAIDHAKVQLKDNGSKDDGIGVVKFAIDSGVSGVKDGYVDPGEGIDYYVIVTNKSDDEVEFNLTDIPDSNVVFDLGDDVTVSPSSYLVTSNPNMEDLTTGNLTVKIPAHKFAEISYHVDLKDIDSGLATDASLVSNEINACRADEANKCGSGEAHLPISSEKYIGITKEVLPQTVTDTDGDGIYDVANGEKLIYTITGTNKGNTTTDIRITDDFPSSFLDVMDTSSITVSSGYTTDPASPTVADLIGDGVVVKDVLPGDSFEISFLANVKTADEMLINGIDYSGYITNIAEACTETNTRLEDKCSSTDVSVEYNNPTDPLHPNFTLIKEITDETGSFDGIAQTGEELTFRIKLLNKGLDTASYTITDEFEDVNVDYVSSNSEDLTKIGGTGEFTGDHRVSNLIDNPNTPPVEGTKVTIDPNQYIEFTFTANVNDPLTDEGKYNSEITNTVHAYDEDANENSSQSLIPLDVYNRMDITKTYTTNNAYVNPDPSITDIYYVTGSGDTVYYNIEYKNIGTNIISNFTIKDFVDKSAYLYDPMTPVTIYAPSGNSTITLEQLTYGYDYVGDIAPNESLNVTFEVTTRDSLDDREDGFLIPNVAQVCYDDTVTADEKCMVSGTETPLDKDGIDVIEPSRKFTIEKWIEDSKGDGDGFLSPNENVTMHILVVNNTDDDLGQFDADGTDEDIDVTDDLTDPNFVYDLDENLTLENIITGDDVTDNSDVVDHQRAKLKTIDRATAIDPLTITIKDGEGIEITFDTVGASHIV